MSDKNIDLINRVSNLSHESNVFSDSVNLTPHKRGTEDTRGTVKLIDWK